MTNHLKSEIIYYNCATDFEFEFSMNSLCHMRLLSEVSNDRKIMLTHLSRAVSRSRVIFIISPFSDEFIETISHSIGFKIETIVANEYGITEQTTSKFITNGVPLVTVDGIYGGIILESGPQSLILLTDDNLVRKGIMKQLVNQYILDLCECTQSPQNDIAENAVEVEEISETETTEEIIDIEPLEEEPINTEISTEEILSSKETDFEYVTEQDAQLTTEENVDEIITEIQDELENVTDEFIVPAKKKSNGLTILTVILSIILLVLFAFIVYSLIIEPKLNGVSILANFKRTFSFLL